MVRDSHINNRRYLNLTVRFIVSLCLLVSPFAAATDWSISTGVNGTIITPNFYPYPEIFISGAYNPERWFSIGMRIDYTYGDFEYPYGTWNIIDKYNYQHWLLSVFARFNCMDIFFADLGFGRAIYIENSSGWPEQEPGYHYWRNVTTYPFIYLDLGLPLRLSEHFGCSITLGLEARSTWEGPMVGPRVGLGLQWRPSGDYD